MIKNPRYQKPHCRLFFQGNLEGYFRGCSGLLRAGFGRRLVETMKGNQRKQVGQRQRNKLGKNIPGLSGYQAEKAETA